MVKKIKKYLKFTLCCALIMSLIAPSYAALSASDGSAFVTKAEFDAALADFNSRLTTFEAGINSKIDSQVTSYLDRNGIWNGRDEIAEFLDNFIEKYKGESNTYVNVSGTVTEIFYFARSRDEFESYYNSSVLPANLPRDFNSCDASVRPPTNGYLRLRIRYRNESTGTNLILSANQIGSGSSFSTWPASASETTMPWVRTLSGSTALDVDANNYQSASGVTTTSASQPVFINGLVTLISRAPYGWVAHKSGLACVTADVTRGAAFANFTFDTVVDTNNYTVYGIGDFLYITDQELPNTVAERAITSSTTLKGTPTRNLATITSTISPVLLTSPAAATARQRWTVTLGRYTQSDTSSYRQANNLCIVGVPMRSTVYFFVESGKRYYVDEAYSWGNYSFFQKLSTVQFSQWQIGSMDMKIY